MQKNSGLFTYLLLLTGLFIVLEVSYFIQWSGVYLGDYKLVSHHIQLPNAAIIGFSLFILLQLSLHLLFTIFVWGLARLLGATLRLSWNQTVKCGFGFWIAGIITLLLANQYFYPNSKYAALTNTFISLPVLKIILLASLFFWIPSIFIGAWGILRKFSFKAAIASLAAIGILVFTLHRPELIPQNIATQEKPNVILIGVDSLRPDYLQKDNTPHLDAFFKQATVFSESYTPLARTFPAWTSILTGQYPKNNSVRTILLDQKNINLSHTLPALLREYGYQTIYASDEVRFSNMTSRFGFDEIVSPPVGFNDFLLGALNDFPMSNLLVNTKLGKYLLPYSYGNRPAYTTYDPNTFLQLLQPTLAMQRDKPLFLSVHFCLAHLPFFWGREPSTENVPQDYHLAVNRVDQQVGDLLKMLEKNNLLKNSIVVIFSDHGEALELAGDRVTEAEFFIPGVVKQMPRFYPPSKDSEAVNQSAGHGGDVLGLTQYHTVLAFRQFGQTNKAITVSDRASLLDIKPTILDLLNYSPMQPAMDGRSLKGYLRGEKNVAAHSYFFMESDYTPQALRTVHPEMRDFLFEALDSVNVDAKTTLITLKDDIKKVFYSAKQFANLSDEWILALYPQNNTEMMPILVNLKTKQWTNDLRTPFAKASPADTMLAALKEFYGDEIKYVQNRAESHDPHTE